MAPSPVQLLAAVRRSGVKYDLAHGWDDPKIAASGHWDPQYVIQHHTAGTNSLAFVIRGTYPPVRNCHFLIGRDGVVHVIYAHKCYHAGKGGPGRWGDGPAVPLDSMNGYAYGIEIESEGKSLTVTATDGITAAQYDALARLNAVLLDLLGATGEGRIINHRTWAPLRKVDTRDTDAHLQSLTHGARVRLNVKASGPIALPGAPAVRVPIAPFRGPYREGTHGPVVATMRAALRLPAGDRWDATVTKAYGSYLLRHPYLIATGARSYLLTARAYASLVKAL